MVKQSLFASINKARSIPEDIPVYSLKMVKERAVRYGIDEVRINGPEDVAKLGRDILKMDELPEEQVIMVGMSVKNTVTGIFVVSHGGLNSSIVHPREVFKRALVSNSAAIVLIHNHPSGDPTPSEEDIRVTRRLIDAGKLLGVNVLDHIIIGEGGYCSLKADGAL